MEILKVKNLSFSYPCCGKALESVSFTVKKGEFITVCGATGSGKSTLLRMLKRELTPLGDSTGEIFFGGTPLEELDSYTSACKIGFVMQRPEQQTVTDKVWHELAFGLEGMGLSPCAVRLRVAEMSSYFGISDWFELDTAELSGGQRQLLNLASVMAMQPEVLLLDEPTSQLDPVAAEEFISTLCRLNRELSLTIIIVEHRLGAVVPVCDRMMVLEKGKITDFDTPAAVCGRLSGNSELLCGMPAAVRLFAALNTGDAAKAHGECPLTVRQGRELIEGHFGNGIRLAKKSEYRHSEVTALEFSDVSFRYRRELSDVLRGLSLRVYENESFCILGGNGSGKTTALSAAAGLIKPYAGKISVFGKNLKDYKNQSLYRGCAALLPQDVQTLFLRNTVSEELEDVGAESGDFPFDLSDFYERHPYDLSGGEQQLVALAKILASKPRLLLLDEPTKGLDAAAKQRIAQVITALRSVGVTVVTVTHDVEFAACIADRCALFFRGEAVSVGVRSDFFAGNSFYTTAANRMTRGYYDGVVTVEDAAELCRLNGSVR